MSNGFKPFIQNDKNPTQNNLRQMANDTLRIGDMSMAVELPKGQDINEWLAVNTIEFFNEISLIFGCLTEYCTPERCPKMSAGPYCEYLWADSHSKKKAQQLCASKYIDNLMTWVLDQIHNESIFPSKIGESFPNNFEQILKKIFQRFFRVYAHIYHSHFQHISFFEALPHLNTSFKHFIYFVEKFRLIDENDMSPLMELINEFRKRREESKKDEF